MSEWTRPQREGPSAYPRRKGTMPDVRDPRESTRAVVLVVDDDTMTRNVLRRTLERLGCTVEEAADGGEAVDRVARQRFDLVLMDHQMPTMDGLTATRCIRALPDPARRTPIVGVTGGGESDGPLGALAGGMDDCIAKPFRRDDIAAVLRRILGPDPGTQGGADGAQEDARRPILQVGANAAARDSQGPGRPDATSLPPGVAEALAVYDCGPGFQVEVLSAFADSAPDMLQRLRDTMLAQDGGQAAFQAHALKGMVGNIGLGDLREQFARIEVAARVGLIDDAAERTERAGRDLWRALRQVKRWLSENGAGV